MTARRRGRAALAGLVACCAALLGMVLPAPGGSAAAQPVERAETAGLALEVRAVDGTITPERPLRVKVQVHNRSDVDRDDVRLVATVHRALVGRWQLRQAVEEGEVGNIVHPHVVDLDAIPASGSRTVEVIQSAEDIGLTREAHEGVYPLRLQLVADADVVDEVITSIVVVPGEVVAPLDVAVLLPLAAPPARDAEGVVVDDTLVRALEPDGSLATTVDVLASHPELTAVVGLDGHTLADLADLIDGFAVREDGVVAVRDVSTPTAQRAQSALALLSESSSRPRVETVAMPYAAGDLVALVRNDLADEASRHIVDGAATVEWVTDRPPVADVLWPADELDDATLAVAKRSGSEGVILHHGWLTGEAEGPWSPAPVRRVAADGGPVTAFVPDPYLVRALGLTSEAGPAIDAQRVLAELASIYFERPGTPDRGALVGPPPGSPLAGDLLAALAGPLSDAPFLRGATLAELERRVPSDGAVARLAHSLEARRRELPPRYAAALAAARRDVGSLGGVLTADRSLPARFDRLLLQSASVHYRGEALPRGRDLLQTVSRTVDELYDAVELPDSPPVTLTAVQGELPVTIRSNADVAMRVRVAIRTPRYDIEGGPVREVELAPDSTQILTFDVRALAPGGTSPVQVVVTDVDGVVQLTSGTIVVRSTAFSVVGLVLTIGAAVFLVAFFLRQVGSRRQGAPGAARGAAAPGGQRGAARRAAAAGGRRRP